MEAAVALVANTTVTMATYTHVLELSSSLHGVIVK